MFQILLENAPRAYVSWQVVFFEDGPMVPWVAEKSIPVTVIEAGRLRNPLHYLKTVRRLTRLMREHRSEIVLSWMTKAHLYAGVAARIIGIPAVWWQHGIPQGDWLDRWASRVPAAWVGCSSEAVARAQVNFTSEDCRVVYPGLNFTDFNIELLPDPQVVREELGIPADVMVIGTVARLQRWKGVHVFLQAAAKLMKQNPALSVVVVGGAHFSEPDYPAMLRSLVQDLGIGDRTIFTGHRQDVPRLMNAFDIFVHSSISPEPFGIVITEAMALGKPVIAVRSGGPAEILEDGISGLLVSPNDVDSLCEALSRLIQSDSLRNRLQREGLRRVRANFSGSVMSQTIALQLASSVRDVHKEDYK